MGAIRLVEIRKRYPGIDNDLASVANGLGCRVDALEIELVFESLGRFANTVSTLEATYPQFPQEDMRTDRIVRLLQAGHPLWPVFADARGFIVEGRHRVVAAHRLGHASIPVAKVRMRETP